MNEHDLIQSLTDALAQATLQREQLMAENADLRRQVEALQGARRVALMLTDIEPVATDALITAIAAGDMGAIVESYFAGTITLDEGVRLLTESANRHLDMKADRRPRNLTDRDPWGDGCAYHDGYDAGDVTVMELRGAG